MGLIVYPAPSKPMSVARNLTNDVFTTKGAPTLRNWFGEWFIYEGKSWVPVNELTVKGPIWQRLEEVHFDSGKDGFVEFNPTTAKVSNVMEPLAVLNSLTNSSHRDVKTPMWIQGEDEKPSARHLIVMNNGMLNFRTGEFTPGHDSTLFNLWHLPFDYDPDARCPVWLKFLDQIFAHDQAARDALQEYAGYLVSGRTDLQKGFIIIGPKRGGKGTISRTLQQIVGLNNVVSPSLHTLGSEFGLASLIGKQLAVVEDARADHSSTVNTAVEKLLNIIGEDPLTINRKNKDHWQGTLPTRIMLISNEVPRLNDASGAILGRFVSVKLRRSFADNPDSTLGTRISRELPGIFNWALEGLARLEEKGTFTTPRTQTEVTEIMSDLSQPVATFLDDNDRYTLTGDPEDHVLLRNIHAAYRKWCEAVGASPLKQANFAQALSASDPGIEFKNTTVDGQPKARRIFGVKEVSKANVWEISQQSA